MRVRLWMVERSTAAVYEECGERDRETERQRERERVRVHLWLESDYLWTESVEGEAEGLAVDGECV